MSLITKGVCSSVRRLQGIAKRANTFLVLNRGLLYKRVDCYLQSLANTASLSKVPTKFHIQQAVVLGGNRVGSYSYLAFSGCTGRRATSISIIAIAAAIANVMKASR